MQIKSLFFLSATSLCVAVLAGAAPQAVQTSQVSDLRVVKTTSAISYPVTIVELFTSQGCSSCPPTNKLVHDLAGTENLLALSYSVDYWDYLGWKDTLGSPDFSERQRKYGQQFSGQVYTPQIVLNGSSHAARFQPDHIKSDKLDENSTNVTLKNSADGLKVQTNGQVGTLIEVRYRPGSQSVPVARGENRGRTITLANVVTSVKKLGSWEKSKGYETVLALPAANEAVAVLVQDGEGGPILAAANYNP